MKIYTHLLLIILATANILMLGCSQDTVLTVYTSIPEVTLYAELYNSTQEDSTVVVKYYENPLDYSEASPDIVIGHNISNINISKKLIPLTRIQGEFDLYPGLLEGGIINGKQYLLPLAFALPIIEFIPENLDEYEQKFWITADELEALGNKHTTLSRSLLTRLGFSPDWNSEFLYEYLKLAGANFHSNESGRLVWNQLALEFALQKLRQWIRNITENDAADFNERYISNNLHRALEKNYIAYHYATLDTFFAMPQQLRMNKDFWWLSDGSKIYPADNVVYAGMTSSSKNASMDFFRWLFSVDAQVQLLEVKQSSRLPEFGIAGMLSAIPEVNEYILPQYYKQLVGKIPSRKLIGTAAVLPPAWETFKHEFLFTWLTQSAQGPSPVPFETIIQEWYLTTNK